MSGVKILHFLKKNTEPLLSIVFLRIFTFYSKRLHFSANI